MSMIHWKSDFIGNFGAVSDCATGDWAGGAGPATGLGKIGFNAGGDFAGAAWGSSPAIVNSPTLTTLVNFAGADGKNPIINSSLFVDAAGDIFGTTAIGGADNNGTVFELVNKVGGYAGKPKILVSFGGADGAAPEGGLIADAAGDLFGMTYSGGANGDGTVFEIARTRHGYASASTMLIGFTGANGAFPTCGLIADAAGDLFGMTAKGGTDNEGTVFEIAKTRHGYASAPITLVSFTGADGAYPERSLIVDAEGDLFGTTYKGGVNGDGTVFEIAKTRHGYASTPTTLASFNDANGRSPLCTLVADAAGNLFGTTAQGGLDGDGTVFEIIKTRHGYASTPTTLVNFSGPDGAAPEANLIIDAAGNLFGTAYSGGAANAGTVFEIAKTQQGYATSPTTLVSFTGADGANPDSGLTADAAGNLFGTTYQGGTNNDGTLFEVADSGFLPHTVSPVTVADAGVANSSPSGAAFVQAMASHGRDRIASSDLEISASPHAKPMFVSLPRVT